MVALALLMRPGIVSKLGDNAVQQWMDAGRLIAAVLSIALYFYRVRIDLFGALVMALGGLALLSIVVNGQVVYFFTEFWLPSCAAALLARSLCPERTKELLWAVLIVSSTISILNLATVLLFPGGIPAIGPDNYFNGNRNGAIIAILPSIASSFVLDAMRGKVVSLRSGLFFVVGFSQIVLAGSATSLLALTGFAVGWTLLCIRSLRTPLNLFLYMGLYALFFIFVVVVGADGGPVLWVQELLGKSMTFTGRTVIWDQAIENVLSTNVLIGCARDAYSVSGRIIGSAHNMVLEVFVQGGVLGVMTWIALLGAVAWKLFRGRMDRANALLALTIGCFLLIGLMEQTRWPALFLFLGIGYCAGLSCRGSRPFSSGSQREERF